MLIKSPANTWQILKILIQLVVVIKGLFTDVGCIFEIWEKICYLGVWTVGRMVKNISSLFFLKSHSFNQYTLRFRRLDASFWELHIKLLNSEGEPTWSQPEERVERRSTCRRQTAARPHKKSSSCRIYGGEWFLSGQSQSPVRPVLGQTPEEIQTESVK